MVTGSSPVEGSRFWQDEPEAVHAGTVRRRVPGARALRPALIPILTETGSQFGWLLGGTVLVESIFAWPGVGQYAFNGIQFLDLPAIMGVTFLLTLFKVVANLLVDMLYVVVDPRVVY